MRSVIKFYFSGVIFLYFFIVGLPINAEKIVFIIPPGGYDNDKLFDLNDNVYNRDNCQYPFWQLRRDLSQKGFLVTTLEKYAKEADYIVIINTPAPNAKAWDKLKKWNFESKKVIGFEMEPITVLPWIHDTTLHKHYWKVFTMEDDLVDNKKYHKFYYPQPT